MNATDALNQIVTLLAQHRVAALPLVPDPNETFGTVAERQRAAVAVEGERVGQMTVNELARELAALAQSDNKEKK